MPDRFRRALFAGSLLPLAGCVFNGMPTGPTKHDSRSVDRDKSEMVRVELKMGAGELKVGGGAAKLVDADFTYNVAAWKPEVRYSSSGFRGNLTIAQPSGSSTYSGGVKYAWDLRFSEEVPLDLELHFGAGEARMDLGSLELRSLNIHMGVGELRLDLRGNPKRDYDVEIHGGVGEATIRLPKDVGVVADAAGGIGGISTRGLRKSGGRWVNDAYEHARATIRLRIRGGVGAINLIAE